MKKETPAHHIPKVAGKGTAGKTIIAITAIAVVGILVRGFFTQEAGSSASKKPEPMITVADSKTIQPNLNYTIAPVPTTPLVLANPLPVAATPPPPPPPPPSVLSAMRMNAAADTDLNNQTRLKSPTEVYDGSKKAEGAFSLENRTTAGSDSNSSFMQQAANAPVITVQAKQNQNMDYKILQGKFISAVLETSVNSTMPGMVRAVVNKDVYSDTGKFILLPRGTRLIGMYNSSLTAGQTRVMIVWTRAITPQHADIAIGSPNADNLGQSGMGGVVDSHFWQIFGTSALLSVLGAATTNGAGGDTAAGNYQSIVAQGMVNTSSSMLQNRMNIQPTIHVAQGSSIQVFVARDLDFSSLQGAIS